MSDTNTSQSWPPDYTAEMRRRLTRGVRIREDRDLQIAMMAYYAKNPIEFINDFCVTFDPRLEGRKRIPFILFPKQKEFVELVIECIRTRESMLVEKCRDVGASWICVAISVWLWIFTDGATIGWGSRKEEYVDQKGNPKAIFPKIRQIIQHLPFWMMPYGFNMRDYAPYMKIINPMNDATITGEAGDNIGRGGRSTIFFKDEAQPLNAMILTPNGWENMGNMFVGKSIVGSDGRPTKITHIKDFEEHDIYQITLADGAKAECSPNHLWTVDLNGKSITVPTTRLLEIFDYVSPRGVHRNPVTIKNIKPVEFQKRKQIYPLDPYIVGVLLGDGSIKHVPKYRPSFTSIDQEIVDEVRRLLPADCKITSDKDGMHHRINDIQGRRGRFKISRASAAIMDAGIAGHGAETKFIPDAYKFGSIEDRLSVLQGLMDTDGSSSSPGSHTFHTCSTQLADDVRFLVRSLGGKAHKAIKKDKRGFLDQIVIYICLPDGMNPFRLSRKAQKVQNRKQSIHRSITDIKIIRRAPVRCITVENADGLYVTDDFIVTHNSAHYEHPELIEAALSENTEVQVDISSVNGSGNVFYRRRMAGEIWTPGKKIESGVTRVFIFDWRDHPGKSIEWYEKKRKKFEAEGLLHIFAQEIDRDYAGSVVGVIIPAIWVNAIIDAHIKLADWGDWYSGEHVAGQDIADNEGGGDMSANVGRHGSVINQAEEGSGDPGVWAEKAKDMALENNIFEIYYDSIGVGSGFKVGVNKMAEQNKWPQSVRVMKWDAGDSPLDPTDPVIVGDADRESPTNEDQYENLKAQSWFRARTRIYKTYRAVMFGDRYDVEEMVSIDSRINHLHKLKMQLSQAVKKTSKNGKTMVDKTPEGTQSPNLADAAVMCLNPTRELSIFDVL